MSYYRGVTVNQLAANLGNTQEPCNDMAYLLVHTEGDSEAEIYGMALVWTSPHQA